MKRFIFILAALLMVSHQANAANSTVAAMTPASALSGSELVYVVQGGTDRKATPGQFATYFQGLITGDCSISGNNIICTKINGVSFAPSATIDTTNASNISSGTLNTLLLPAPFTSATKAGSTSVFATTSGTLTSGNCVQFDASGNIVAAAAPCGTGGSSTITAGTTATSGITSGTFLSSTTNLVTDTAKAIPTGAVVGTTDTQTLTNKSISGSQINSGTIAAAQGGAGTINGALKGNGSGVVSQAACADLSNGTVLCSTTPGTGVATALGVNVGTAGAPVINGGALGTPSSGVATSLTGTASGLTAGTVTTNANQTGDVTSSGNATTYANVVPAAKGGAGTVTGALKANGSGTVSQAACADLSNGSASCSTDTTNATNIASGSLADARLTSNVSLKNGSNAFTSANSFSGSTTWTGNLITPIRTITAAGAVTVSATTDYFICVNKTSGAATTVNLPASPTTGLTYLIKDCKGDAATNNITVTPAAGNIDNSPSFVMNTNLQSVAVTFSGSQWFVN